MIEILRQIDAEALLAINSWHTAFLDPFMKMASARLVWIPFYLSILYVLWRARGWKATLGIALLIGLLITLADQSCATLIRPYVQRLRPTNPDNPLSQFVTVVDGYRGGSYGFPSCHASNTFALAVFLTFITRNRLIIITMFLWAVLNCYSRMYLGVHYPGDILAGALLGTLCAFLVYALFRLALRRLRHPLPAPIPASPALYLPIPTAFLLSLLAFALVSLVP